MRNDNGKDSVANEVSSKLLTKLGAADSTVCEREQVEERFRSENHPLRSIIMLITEQCNLRCDYCYIYKAARKMTLETAERSVDFLFNNARSDGRRLGICFFGGEPLLEPDLVRYIAEYAMTSASASGRNVSFSMTTNATLLDKERFELIKKYNIDTTFSLDGIKSVHDRHRRTVSGRGSFQFIERNMERLLALPRTNMRLTVTPETADTLDHSVRWLIEQGFNRISVSPVYEAEWDVESLGKYYDAWNRIYQYQAELLEREPGSFRVNNIDTTQRKLVTPGPREYGCGAARNMVAIDAAGDIYPCHRFIGYFKNGAKQRIGDVFSGFYIPKREYYIASNHTDSQKGCGSGLFNDTVAPENHTCSSCALAKGCGSSCMAINEHMSGSPRQPHPINRVLAQIHLAVHLQNRARIFPEGDGTELLEEECTTP